MKVDAAKIWYAKSRHPIVILLLPFSYLYSAITATRHWLYRKNILKTIHANVPVIVVGNITVGGTGKTPFVIWLAKFLKELGYQPGIVSRGVGGEKQVTPHLVNKEDAASKVGDEALLLMQNTACPVMLCINRVAAVNALLSQHQCNIIISDDGLQHYRMGRKFEIVMMDGERHFGNQYLLPAGPLREPVSRLKKTDMVVMNGGDNKFTMTLQPLEFVSVINNEHKISFQEFSRKKVHAVAGIGNPQRFFNILRKAGFDVIEHAFPDHHLYQPKDLNFSDNLPIIMTEKDSVKCRAFADERHWFLRVEAIMNQTVSEKILDCFGHIS